MSNSNGFAIVDFELRAPGAPNRAALTALFLEHSKIPHSDSFESPTGRNLQMAQLEYEENSAWYPRKSDLKAMRTEVIAAVEAAGWIFARNTMGTKERESCGVYFSTSPSPGQTQSIIDQILSALGKSLHASDFERNTQVVQDLHPLFGLKALTSASASFVAQTYGLKGETATFGDTMLGGFEALKLAAVDLEEKRSCDAIVGGTNASGLYALASIEKNFGNNAHIRESPGAALLLLKASSDADTSWNVSWKNQALEQIGKNDLVINSSCYTEEDLAHLSKRVASDNFCSTYSVWGSLGAAALPGSLALGMHLAQLAGRKSFFVCEQDLLGDVLLLRASQGRSL